jgi:hypothetical protein
MRITYSEVWRGVGCEESHFHSYEWMHVLTCLVGLAWLGLLTIHTVVTYKGHEWRRSDNCETPSV